MPEAMTFLMFDGATEEALGLYREALGITPRITARWTEGEGPAGKIKEAHFVIGDQRFVCMDSPVRHDFSFTPSVSIFMNFDDETAFEKAWNRLIQGGATLMPLDDYGFSRRFGWLNDRFGVSWQLNLA